MLLSRDETTVLRGIAIALIVIHNVTHILCPFRENEFGFSAENVTYFFSHFPAHPIDAFFSFYGWTGVSVFVFASAYGLMAKYGESPVKPLRWLGGHYLKLVLLTAPAMFLLFVVGKGLIGGTWEAAAVYIPEQTFLLNIIDPSAIVPGIYWYVGMAFQLYVFFLLVRRLRLRYLGAIWIVSVIFLALIPDIGYFRHNFPGWIPEFVFGMMWYRCKDIQFGRSAAALQPLVIAAFFVAASTQRYSFFLCGPLMVALLLSIRHLLMRMPLMRWLGGISASVYILHALIRSLLMNLEERSLIPVGEEWPLLYSVAVFAASILLAIPYDRYYRFVCRRF